MAVLNTDYTRTKDMVLQIAPEATPGVAATTGFKKLHAMNIDVNSEFEADIDTPRGARFPTSQALIKEMAKAALSGKPDFNEIDFALASLLRKPTITGSSPAYTRVYDVPNVAGSETRQTYTIQYGRTGAGNCETYAGCLLADLQLTFDRDGGISQSGNIMLGALSTATALVTAGVTEIAKAPMLAKNVNVWVSDTQAGLGQSGNKVELPFVFVWGMNGRADDYWALNSAYTGPAMYEEGEGQGYAGNLKVPSIYGLPKFLAKIRAGEVVFTRVEVSGAILNATPDPDVLQLLRIDQCWFTQDLPTDNYKAVYAKNVGLVGAQSSESGWLKSCEVTLINGIAGS